MPIHRKRAEIVALLVLLSLLSYFQRISMSIAGPSVAREFSLSETQMGEIYSAFLLGYALCMIPGGWLADRFGPRPTIAVVAMATAIFTALIAMIARPALASAATVLASVIAIRFLLGCCTAPLYPACARMNANWMPIESRAHVQGWIAAGAGIGGALAPILFTWAIAEWGWRPAFLLTGAITVGIGLLWLARTSDHPPGSRRPPASSREQVNWRALLSNRNLVLVTLAYAATGYFEYIFFFWVFYYLGEIRHVGPSQSAIYTTALFGAWAVMAPLGGQVSDFFVKRYGQKLGSRIVPIVGLSAGAACVVVGVGLSSASATGLMFALALGLAAATDGAYWAAAIEIGGHQSGAAGATMNTGGNAAGFLAPVLTPWIAARFGWSSGLYFGCAVAMIAVLTWFLIDTTAKTKYDDRSWHDSKEVTT